MDASNRPVLLYDDGCRLCRAAAEAVLRWERAGRLDLRPWSDPQALAWMAQLPPAVRDGSMHVRMPDGALLRSGDAMVALLDALPGLRWLGALAHRNAAVHHLVDWGYGLVARNRETLSHLVPNRPPVARRAG